jgi:DNA-binding MarR family transcriptional regulator
MKAAGLVVVAPGADARSKVVSLTPAATAMAGRLAAEWRATEAASAELEAELPYPLSQVVRDMEEALARRSFHDRIAAYLAEDPDWS